MSPTLTRRLFLFLSLALLPISLPADPAKWAAEIETLTQHDTTQPPPANGIVFIGSSSIQKWHSLHEDFPGLPVIRRGFGGSELTDSVFYIDRLVLAYHPRAVVLYAGENDIAAGKSPEKVAADFHEFCTKLHAAQPGVHLYYISIKPSPRRWSKHEPMQQANALIAAQCANNPRLTFVDVNPPMLGTDGQPKPELFIEDRLHMNHDGYLIWTKLLTPLLQP